MTSKSLPHNSSVGGNKKIRLFNFFLGFSVWYKKGLVSVFSDQSISFGIPGFLSQTFQTIWPCFRIGLVNFFCNISRSNRNHFSCEILVLQSYPDRR